jgi:catechol 2,3-dioxygenase-like lactoylglutathione lyase family enzyme
MLKAVLGSAELVAFVPTTDLDRARFFYEGALGLEFVSRGPNACVFSANGVPLRVTLVAEVAPAGYTVLGWRVADVAVAAAELQAGGVELLRFDGLEQDHLGVWVSLEGARVAWFKDPDGNTLSVTQL